MASKVYYSRRLGASVFKKGQEMLLLLLFPQFSVYS